jgi:hypothetical protein
MSRIRPGVTLVALTILVALALPGRAIASPPTFHDHFSDTFTDTICGVAVTVDVDINQVGRLVFDANGNVVEAMITGQASQTFTAANGKTVTINFAGQYRQESVSVDPVTGFVTFVESWRGLPEKISGATGAPLLRDAGFIRIASTFDFSGPEPVLVDRQILVNHGPHPEAESDFTLFCEVITQALA